ncbi:hypothetical protein KKC97_11520, partial [bacterium]|nr:hypothetical protein [bacterium]
LALAGALILISGGLILYFPNAFLNRQATAKLTEYLVKQLGPEAVVAEVDLGWRQAVIQSIHLPLGSKGSSLEISRIEFDIDPLALFSQPEHIARVIRGVSIIEPRVELNLLSDTTSAAKPDTSGEAPAIRIPAELFDVLSKLDSLHCLEIVHGRISISDADSSTTIAKEINGSIMQTGMDQLSIDLTGHYLDTHRNRISISGEIQPKLNLLQLTAVLTIPEGLIAQTLHDSLSVTSSGGELRINAWSAGRQLHYNGSLAISDIAIGWGRLAADIPSLQGDISENGMDMVAPEINSDWFAGDLYGTLSFRDGLKVNLRGSIEIDTLSSVPGLYVSDLPLAGAVSADYLIQGSLTDPAAYITIQSDSIRVGGFLTENLAASVRTDFHTLNLDRLDLVHPIGELSATGSLALDSTNTVLFDGQVKLADSPTLAGIESDIRTLRIRIDGDLKQPEFSLTVNDSRDRVRGLGRVEAPKSADNDGWEFHFRNPVNSREGQAYVRESNGQWVVNALGANILLGILFPKADSVLVSVNELFAEFVGDEYSGSLLVQLLVDPDSSSVFPQLIRQLEFSGNYVKPDSDSYDVDGSWSGLTGSGKPFFGQGGLIIRDGVIEFSNLFIDEAGSITGQIDLKNRHMNASLSIDQLPFDSFPIRPVFFDKTGLRGILSGETHLQGSFDNLGWTSSFTLVDGSVFGVPGYWCNIDAFGEGLRADSTYLSFGRDIRKILDATGMIDLEADTLSVKAVSGSASSNDFFLALTGINKILTGDLSGYCTLTGKASSPDISIELTITDGEMLGELFVDKFLLRGEFVHDVAGNRVFRIPSLAFGKLDEYRFFGELTADVREGGALTGHLEGSGDFLDLLDQIDGTFYSRGSESRLTIDLGGTFDNPQFVSGSLLIPNGRFAYPSASPSELTLDADIHISAPGVVDQGYLTFKDGDRYLSIQFLQDYQDSYFDLKPLVIPSPRLDLGILKFTTSEDGIPVRLPGFMEPDWIGTFICRGGGFNAITISAQDSSRLLISGGVTIENARFTFPFVASGSGRVLPVTEWLLDRLYEAEWDLEVEMGSGNHYDVEITGFKDSDLSAMLGDQPLIEALADYLDHLTVDAIVDPTEDPLLIRETLEDSTFYLMGRLTSNRGRVDYLDQTFSIDYVTADFDETNVMPILEGRAETYGLDSLNRSVPVYLTIYEIDTENNTRYRQGRFDDVTYVLESDNADSPEAVLQLLGYGSVNTTAKAEQVLARTALSAAKRRWLDPIARQLEKTTIFDEIALTPGGGRSERLFRQQREQALTDTTESASVVRFFTGSHVTVGKYLSDEIFVSYTGELVEGPGDLEGSRLGLVHFWNLELRMDPLARDLVLDFAVEYDEIERRRDESVALKYSFTLEPWSIED